MLEMIAESGNPDETSGMRELSYNFRDARSEVD